MKHLGHIELKDNKIVFVYHEKICKNCIHWNGISDKHKFAQCNYILITKMATSTCEAWKKINEASKREVEVTNAIYYEENNEVLGIEVKSGIKHIEKNQSYPCEAEITEKVIMKDISGNKRHLTKKIVTITKII